MVSSDDGSDARHGRPWGPGWTDLGSWEADLAIGWRRCHSQMVWQVMVALAFAANMYQWGIDNGEDCIKPKYRPVNLMNCK